MSVWAGLVRKTETPAAVVVEPRPRCALGRVWDTESSTGSSEDGEELDWVTIAAGLLMSV